MSSNLPERNTTNWLGLLKDKFDHPAIVLWRATELRHIEKMLGKHCFNKPILDLGCAEGKVTETLFKENSVIGLDNCWELLSQNRYSQTYEALILADGCRMPYKDRTFASIFSNCVVEHIFDIGNLLSEVSRIIKERGVFLFTVPSHKFGDFLFLSTLFNNLGLKSIADLYKKKRNTFLKHFHCYDHDYWGHILKEKGLVLIDYEYYMTQKATFFWDFLAISVFIFKNLWPLSYLLPKVKKWLINYLTVYYLMDAQIGSGLVLVAQREI